MLEETFEFTSSQDKTKLLLIILQKKKYLILEKYSQENFTLTLSYSVRINTKNSRT